MSPSEQSACIDYLHGSVVDAGFEAACTYEYARESKILRDAADEREKLFHQKKNYAFAGQLYEEAAHTIFQKHNCGVWFINPQWSFIWHCRSFPRNPWNQLSKPERREILYAFPTKEIRPLQMTEVMMLKALRI